MWRSILSKWSKSKSAYDVFFAGKQGGLRKVRYRQIMGQRRCSQALRRTTASGTSGHTASFRILLVNGKLGRRRTDGYEDLEPQIGRCMI